MIQRWDTCRAQVSILSSILPVGMILIHFTADNVSDDEDYNCRYLSYSSLHLIPELSLLPQHLNYQVHPQMQVQCHRQPQPLVLCSPAPSHLLVSLIQIVAYIISKTMRKSSIVRKRLKLFIWSFSYYVYIFPIWMLYLCLIYLRHEINLPLTITFHQPLYFTTTLFPTSSIHPSGVWRFHDWTWNEGIQLISGSFPWSLASPQHMQSYARAAVWNFQWMVSVFTHQVDIAPNLGLAFQWRLHIVCHLWIFVNAI